MDCFLAHPEIVDKSRLADAEKTAAAASRAMGIADVHDPRKPSPASTSSLAEPRQSTAEVVAETRRRLELIATAVSTIAPPPQFQAPVSPDQCTVQSSSGF